MPENRLARETSPYLLQHRENPVDWYPWSAEALDRARREGKPILLSVGYSACHWCHVMAHESFEDPEIAAVMNDLFVNVKVDREERPDLDQIYQSALALLGQPGGWPLTMFLTPEGEPFWGGTYFPPTARWGRPGFPDVLRGVAETYRREPDKVTRNVEALRDALGRLAETRSGPGFGPDVLDQAAERLVREFDPFRGGLGEAPKFPNVSILEMLWRAWRRTRRAPFRDAVLTTLRHMSQGGIYDHVGGGFARYSVDAEWLVPHFEKMLYDNAQLVEMLALVWQETRDPLFEARVRETVDWALREMRVEGGGFAGTLDADSEGEEGRFYVWTAEEIDRLLGPDAETFGAAYGVTPEGNWEGTNILNRLHRLDLGDAAHEAKLAELRRVLREARGTRVRPGRDDKVLADWNGLMIAALAEAGMVFDEAEWIGAARAAFEFVRTRVAKDGRLGHSWRDGRLQHPGNLDDHANMARAALRLFEATGETAFLDAARGWTEVLDRRHWDAERGGYFFTPDDGEPLIVRTKTAHDQATPSGNGTMVGVLARLHLLTGEDAYARRAERLVETFAGEIARNFIPLATLMNGVDFVHGALQAVVAGPADDPATRALRRAVLGHALPNRLLVQVAPGAELPPGHPAAGKGMIEGRPAAYLCTGTTCSAPRTNPADLDADLADR